MISYDTLPFKTFHLIMMDQDKNLRLLGIEDPEEAKKVWESILEEWKERHPSPEERDLTVSLRNAMLKRVRLTKLIALLKYMILYTDVPEERQREVFKEAGVRWVDEPLKRLEAMNRMLSKARDEQQIFDARHQKLEQEILEKRKSLKASEKVMTIADINKSIASLEMAGFTIENYEALTCGKYDAMSAALRDQNQRMSKNGSNR